MSLYVGVLSQQLTDVCQSHCGGTIHITHGTIMLTMTQCEITGKDDAIMADLKTHTSNEFNNVTREVEYCCCMHEFSVSNSQQCHTLILLGK